MTFWKQVSTGDLSTIFDLKKIGDGSSTSKGAKCGEAI